MTGSFGVVPQPRRMRPVRRRRRPGWPLIVLAVVLALALFGGGVALAVHKHNEDEHQEMVNVVHSKEGKHALDEGIRGLDPKAFTPEGVIHSYTIDDSSIHVNPMGSVEVTLYANDDKTLYIEQSLVKDADRDGNWKPLRVNGGTNSVKLEDLLEQEKKQMGVDSDTSYAPSQSERWLVK